jgi:hypothetical protein
MTNVHAAHAAPNPADAATPMQPAARSADLRAWADFLCIWRFCDRTACRRSRRCRGQACACFPRYSPLLPDSVKTWLKLLGDAQAQRLTYEQALARIENTPESAAIGDRHLAVGASLFAAPRVRRENAATRL